MILYIWEWIQEIWTGDFKWLEFKLFSFSLLINVLKRLLYIKINTEKEIRYKTQTSVQNEIFGFVSDKSLTRTHVIVSLTIIVYNIIYD